MVTQQSQLGEPLLYAVKQYASAWEKGTGLPIALPPGEYDVTSSEQLGNVRYLLLNERFRVIVDH